MSMCANSCLSSTSPEDRKCFEAISITGGMLDLIWFTLGMYSEYILLSPVGMLSLWGMLCSIIYVHFFSFPFLFQFGISCIMPLVTVCEYEAFDAFDYRSVIIDQLPLI